MTAPLTHWLARIGALTSCLWSLAAWSTEPPPVRPAGAAPAAVAKFNEILATPELVAQVRAGGYVLYMRHGHTDNTKPDRVPTVDLADCNTQRPLTDEGRRAAAQVGAALRKARWPIGEIFVSPLCRAKESAQAAFPGQTATVDKDLIYLANLTDAQKAPVIARTRQLLSAPAPSGSNRLLVAHAPNLMDLIGYFPKEATVVIFRPSGDRFEYLASVPPGLWVTLLP